MRPCSPCRARDSSSLRAATATGKLALTMRVAYLADRNTANGFYRAVGPMTNLAYRGHDVRQLPTTGAPSAEPVRDVDVLLIHRYTDARALMLARAAKAHGAAVIWDDDDDGGALPSGTAVHRKYGGIVWERRLKELRRLLPMVDLVTTPSAHLCERMLGYGARRTRAIENFVAGLFLEAPDRRSAGRTTVGWVAANEHQIDTERVPVLTALQQLLDERSDVEIRSVGVGLGLHGDRYVSVKRVPILDLSTELTRFDVGIAPLADIPFNRARSNVKLKEYAACGAAWLASPVGPYAAMGEREGGRLVADDRWYEQLVRLVDRPRERRKLQKRGAKWVSGQTIERSGEAWEAVLAEAVACTSLAAAS